MKIGYPCINRTIQNGSSKTFRLKSYSDQRLCESIEYNLQSLYDMLRYNVEHKLLFFRISSQLVPFASHLVCTYPWVKQYKERFREIGNFITKNDIRISMHPDQFVLLNSVSDEIFQRSVEELSYHAQVLDLLGLDASAKLQIHVGGVYGDKNESIKRFITRYFLLPEYVQKRLVIENDDRLYSVKDCLLISESTHVPILFDNLHHKIFNNGEREEDIFSEVLMTWAKKDGIPITDYSSQQPEARIGNHAQSIDSEDFKKYILKMQEFDFDIMLEIKDKEQSALKALSVLGVII